MSWLNDTEQHRKRQVALMAKAFGDSDIQKATGNDVSEDEEKKPKKKAKPNSDKSDMYKMKVLGLRKFNEQDQKEYIGVEDVANSYITNHENGDIIISKTTDGYLVSKFPIDTENEEGEEKTVTTLSEAIDVALQYQDDLDNAKAPEQIMYKETEEDDEDSEKGFDDEINPFERAAWEAEQDEIRKAYEALGLDYDEFEKAKHQDGDMHPNGKWVWRQSANGGKGDWRVAKPGGSKAKTGGGAAAPAAKTDDKINKEELKKQLKEFDGKLLAIKKKDGITAIAVQFQPRDYFAADDFVKKHKEWRATTNIENNYEFVYLNKEGIEALRKRGFQKLPDK